MNPTGKIILTGVGITTTLAALSVFEGKSPALIYPDSSGSIQNASFDLQTTSFSKGYVYRPTNYDSVEVLPNVYVGSRLLYQGHQEDVDYLRERYGIVPLRLYSEADWHSAQIRPAGPGHISVVKVPTSAEEQEALRKMPRDKIDLRDPTLKLEGNTADSLQTMVERASLGQLGLAEIWKIGSQGDFIAVFTTTPAVKNPKGYMYLGEFTSRSHLSPDELAAAISNSAGTLAASFQHN